MRIDALEERPVICAFDHPQLVEIAAACDGSLRLTQRCGEGSHGVIGTESHRATENLVQAEITVGEWTFMIIGFRNVGTGEERPL